MERYIDRQIGVSSIACVVPVHTTPAFWSIYIPNLTYGHELWVVTERLRSQIQVAAMSFLQMVAVLSLRDKVRSEDIRRKKGVS